MFFVMFILVIMSYSTYLKKRAKSPVAPSTITHIAIVKAKLFKELYIRLIAVESVL